MKIESANIKCVNEKELSDIDYICRCFEENEDDYLYVKNDVDEIIGVYYLDEFCNSSVPIIDKTIPEISCYRDGEQEVYDKIVKLSPSELIYIRQKMIAFFSEKCVCCCNSQSLAMKIIGYIMGDNDYNIKYTTHISELNECEDVIFLTYNKIKLYRKSYKNKISSLLILNSVINECKNKTIFDNKYPQLIEHFKQFQIGFIYCVVPEETKLNNLGKNDIERLKGYGKTDYEYLAKMLSGKESTDYKSCLIQNDICKVVDNGIYKQLLDCKSDFFNVVGGMRVTTDQPGEFENAIYIFGPCIVRGAMVEDNNTISSLIQKMVVKEDLPYIVYNCGVGGGTDLENTYKYILSLPLKSGDYVVLVEEGKFLLDNDLNKDWLLDLSVGFNKKQITNWFLDRPAHCNMEANSIIGEQIFQRIKEHKLNNELIGSNSEKIKLLSGIKKVFPESKELSSYIDGLLVNKYKNTYSDIVGAIVMHCNPMTKGHKYLIEKALEKVDYLYVFVVAASESDISFRERLQMVEHETAEWSNVKVFPGGKFMASTETFPAYFEREKNKDVLVDATKDILSFCQYVAPALGISKRFVGTENRDFVTRQYNNQLKMILPMYGIELFEFERYEIDGLCVSAHSTRELLNKRDWVGVNKMVTEYVYGELIRIYEGPKEDI